MDDINTGSCRSQVECTGRVIIQLGREMSTLDLMSNLERDAPNMRRSFDLVSRWRQYWMCPKEYGLVKANWNFPSKSAWMAGNRRQIHATSISRNELEGFAVNICHQYPRHVGYGSHRCVAGTDKPKDNVWRQNISWGESLQELDSYVNAKLAVY